MLSDDKWLGIIGVLLVSLCSGAAYGQVHRCQGIDGLMVFQDRPCIADEVKDKRKTLDDVIDFGPNKHFLWQASTGKGTLYLLGSIHFGNADMYPLPRVMTSMFRRSDVLVVEADVVNVNPIDLAPLITKRAHYQEGDDLQKHLTVELWQRLSQAAIKLGMSVELLKNQKPWFAAMSLTALTLNRMGFSQDRGIDHYFINLARGKKPVVELESIAFQLSLFDQFSESEQIMMLEEALSELEYGPEYFEKMLNYWRSGDQNGIQSMFDDSVNNNFVSDRFQKLIMIDRNYTMTDKLHDMANQGGRYFVVVGAGHLTGSEGIISLLEQRGYTVEQL